MSFISLLDYTVMVNEITYLQQKHSFHSELLINNRINLHKYYVNVFYACEMAHKRLPNTSNDSNLNIFHFNNNYFGTNRGII